MWEAPLDEPPCGFDGTGCFDPPTLIREIISGVLFFLLLGLSITCWIMYKNWKYEQEIAGLLWRIPIPEIQRYGSFGIVSSNSRIERKGCLDSIPFYIW
ncbi:guanylate cyclase [Trichonephila clavipes]|nr:guanylate cyclase [Trichonephila clavipes]